MAQVASEEWARELFLRHNGDGRSMHDCCSDEELAAYHQVATFELEQKWRKEAFLEHYTAIISGSMRNVYHFQKMCGLYQGQWEQLYQAAQMLLDDKRMRPGEAGHIAGFLMQEAGGYSSYSYTDKQIFKMFQLGKMFIDRFRLKIEIPLYYRSRVMGVKNLEEAQWLFQKEFGSPSFRTRHAKESYDSIVTPDVDRSMSHAIFNNIAENGTDEVNDFRMLFRLFLEHDIQTEQNIQTLYHYMSCYKERIRKCFWFDVTEYIVIKLIPKLYDSGYRTDARKFLALAEQLISKEHVFADIPRYQTETKEIIQKKNGYLSAVLIHKQMILEDQKG